MREPASPPSGSPITAADLAEIRACLPALAGCEAYLNAGTLGPVPQVAHEAMAAHHAWDRLVRQGGDLWTRLVEVQADARGAVALLTGVASEQVALMHSTHEGINTCLWGMGVASGDNVVTTDQEHPGVLVPLRHVRDRCGVEVRIAPWSHDGSAAWVEAITGRVDACTRAVVVSHVSWTSGAVAPLRELRAELPNRVRIIVDGAQSAGVLAVDPTDGWDAYTVSGQKWPCGPNGSGGLALLDPEAWLPTYGGFLQVLDPAASLDSLLQADGRRFETSQESMAPLAGLAASAAWLVGTVGLWRAEAHARLLNAHARTALAPLAPSVGGLRGDAHLLCVDLAPGTAEDVVQALGAAGLVTRNLGPDVLRLSFGCWNCVEEVDELVAVLAQATGSP